MPQKLPWEDWREGEDQMISGWMRATSPAGNADFEGVVQWAGELGYGVRAPEGGQSGLRDDEATHTKAIREVLEGHLLAQDIPADHKGMKGRIWRAKISAERNRDKLEALKDRRRAWQAARKTAP